MELIFDTKNSKYILGKNVFSKAELVAYIQGDMLENLLLEKPINLVKEERDQRDVESGRVSGGKNVLFYGVPGSGKSYAINEKYGTNQSKMKRVVFHPDYMNTDFIGQILPVIKADKTIAYEFVPGPFTTIMSKAYRDPANMYYLVIEEINRGNAPAIFGEIFQLLDRSESGESQYRITNVNVAREMFENPEEEIYIPSNLTILATMNTADQNVFALDTAFQRRWGMKMVENNLEKADNARCEIVDTGVVWETFNIVINDLILGENLSGMLSEDKRLGAYFVTKHDLERETTFKDKARDFSEKVVKYLWDDVFKFSRQQLFDESYKSLEQVIKAFVGNSGKDRFNIFNETVRDALINNIDSETVILEMDSNEK